MADIKKITDLPVISTIADDDILSIVDISEMETKKVKFSDLVPAGVLTTTDVIDNLTSTETTKPLSANQGKVLDTRLTTAESDIITLTKYSTTERAIGTWIDGKPIYRKTVVINGLPNNAVNLYPIGVDNLNMAWINNGLSFFKGDTINEASEPINGLWDASAYWYTNITNYNIQIKTTTDKSKQIGYIVVEYTKTTN